MLHPSKQDKYVVSLEDQTGLESGRRVIRGAQRRPRHYKPLATKSVCLALILAAVLICIILLEVILHQGSHYRNPEDGSGRRMRLVRRQTVTTTTDGGTAASSTVSLELSTNPAAVLSLTSSTTDSTLTTTTDPGAGITSTSSSSVDPTFTTIPGSVLTLTSSSTPVSSATNPGAALTLTSSTTPITTNPVSTESSAALSLTSPTEPLKISTTSKSRFKTHTSDILVNSASHATSSEAPTSATPASTIEGTQLTLTSSTSTLTQVTTRIIVITSGSMVSSFIEIVTATTAGGPTSTNPSMPTTSSAFKAQSTSVVPFTTILTTATDASGQTTSYYLVVEQITASSTAFDPNNPTTTAPGQSTIQPETTSILTLTVSASTASSSLPSLPRVLSTEIVIKGPFTNMDYVNALYLGPFIAVALKIVWDVVFSATKMMEPFYQLAKPGGASAENSLCADYLSSGLSWTSWKAMFGGHWVMILTTVIYIAMGLLAPIASESMTVKAGALCKTPLSKYQPCDPMWVVDLVIARGLEGFLAFIAISIAILTVISARRRSGVFSNPSSLATMAALLGDQAIIEDFRRIDPQASPEILKMALSGNRYKLAHYYTPHGSARQGLTKSIATISQRHSHSTMDSEYLALSNPANESVAAQRRPFPWLFVVEMCFMLSIMTLFGLILGYYLDSKSDPLNNFFNRPTFGPRFVLTVIASLGDTQWKRLEREVRIMEPYRIMSKRRAPSKTTILATMNGTPITTFPIALWRGNFFHAWVAFVAILSDILIIAVAGVPFTGAQIHPVLLASCYTSLAILGLMLCTLVALFRWRMNCPRMPRPPGTLASVWMYLCASRMVEDFHDMETVGAAMRDKAVKRSGRKYWFGLALGKGGQERWMVDYEREGRMVYY